LEDIEDGSVVDVAVPVVDQLRYALELQDMEPE
jgi:hypothetical protein